MSSSPHAIASVEKLVSNLLNELQRTDVREDELIAMLDVIASVVEGELAISRAEFISLVIFATSAHNDPRANLAARALAARMDAAHGPAPLL